MQNSINYFYQGSARWTFGFENPNEVAVIFACLLPLLLVGWILVWDSILSLWQKICAMNSLGLIIFVDALCLFKTYSRGATLAAAVGVLYLLVSIGWRHQSFRSISNLRSPGFSASVVLAGFVFVLFIWVGLGSRSLEPVTIGDASVGHRIILWRSALQMAAENPFGFGTGKSGQSYMQWYQTIDPTSGYRTMVNSYLTFLVEQGWLWFAVVFLGTSLTWFWCVPGKPESVAAVLVAGLRASILAFMISGIFSTIMEEPILWIIPACCGFILICWSLCTRVSFYWPEAALATALPLVLISFMYLYGLAQSEDDSLSRKFANGSDGRTVTELSLKQSSPERKTWVVVADAKVLGPYYGKLLRQLVVETGVKLELKSSADLRGPIDRLLLTGNAVKAPAIDSTLLTVLLSPSVISVADAQAWSTSSPRLILLIPSIDEDRRVRFWRDYMATSKPAHMTQTDLGGVGLRVDWAWEDVIQLIKNS
jgi:hypothetical protein